MPGKSAGAGGVRCPRCTRPAARHPQGPPEGLEVRAVLRLARARAQMRLSRSSGRAGLCQTGTAPRRWRRRSRDLRPPPPPDSERPLVRPAAARDVPAHWRAAARDGILARAGSRWDLEVHSPWTRKRGARAYDSRARAYAHTRIRAYAFAQMRRSLLCTPRGEPSPCTLAPPCRASLRRSCRAGPGLDPRAAPDAGPDAPRLLLLPQRRATPRASAIRLCCAPRRYGDSAH